IPQGQSKSYLDLVREANISFYTCWLGNNDVLGYATSGGAAGVNGDPNRLGLGGITDVTQFQNLYNQLIAVLKAKNAKGVVATIPNVTDIPYFTTIAWNAFPLTAEQATQLNAGLKANIETSVRNAVTKVVVETQIAPAVITLGATLQLVIPPVIREGVKRTTVIPTVINAVGTSQGLSSAQIAALNTAYLNAYLANQETPSAAGTPFSQQLFDVITVEVNNAMTRPDVQNTITDLTTKYSNAYISNQNKPVAVSPYTQEQFDAITEEVKKQTSSNAFKQGVQNQLTAYLANPNAPNFASIKAEVDKQLNSTPVQTAITNEVNKQITALKQGGFYPEVKAGNNPFIISDSRSPTGLRSAKNDDLICLTAIGELTRLGALGQPPILGNAFVLTKTERDPAVAAINSYNEYIRKLAEDPNIALFDANKLFSDVVKNGYSQDGFRNTTAFVTGGIFSLDGVHPTPRGYAIVANEMIKAMNAKFKTNIKQVNIGNYRTVVFPSN
ncbi:MAG: SGNH/GDSL hydrolase family protein, partial [Flammeovirgaceae bacterium]|nr:SGNH/GDSL hydrolase family protein [Flammeovirgaceae bacterium]MDW8288134.1 SGNH/GDSL hydrolase family protein [Flammeovirgaceae bacterium]